ncbi:MAG: hypothetical protein HQK89_09225 [Nitrospirae bacterium]|nr:hypothetical protein [Nitrospirota bacterium]
MDDNKTATDNKTTSENKNLATKRIIYLMLGEDIDSTIRSSLRSDFRGITSLKGYRTVNSLNRALEERPPSLLIVDGVFIESITDFLSKVSESRQSYKILLILPSRFDVKDIENMRTYLDIILDIIIRPFTLKRLYTYLSDRFLFTKPQVVSVSQISTQSIANGMVLAEDVYIPGGTEPLFDCGTVLDEESIKELIKNNVKNIKVHEDTSKFMNCWEVKKCGCVGECPASYFVDADGFLGGINAGRACIYLKHTTGPCIGIYKNVADKVKLLCYKCEFYKMLLKDNIEKTTISDLSKHVEKQKNKKAKEKPETETTTEATTATTPETPSEAPSEATSK